MYAKYLNTCSYDIRNMRRLGMCSLYEALSSWNGKSVCNRGLRGLFTGMPKKFWFRIDTRCVNAFNIDPFLPVGVCIPAWFMYGRSGPQKGLSKVFPIDASGYAFITGTYYEWLRSLMRGLGTQLKQDIALGGVSLKEWNLINHIAYALARENIKEDAKSWDEYKLIEGVSATNTSTYKGYELQALCAAQQFIDWYDGWIAQGLPVDGVKV